MDELMTREKDRSRRRDKEPLRSDCPPKLCGGDIEVGNFVLGMSRTGGTGPEASQALLAEVSGIPHQRQSQAWSGSSILYSSPSGGGSYLDDWDWNHGSPQVSSGVLGGSSVYSSGFYSQPSASSSTGYNRQDFGRKFLPCNGGCIYIDLNHLELCLPEVLSAADHVAAWHAMLLIAGEAMHHANAKLPADQSVQVLVNNSDGLGNSYGSHMNFLLSRRCWDNLFHHKLHQMLFLASYFCSSIIFTGQGKVGAENGAPSVGFQLSQRADFIETITGQQTTWRRPICNSRDESHAGPRSTWNHRDTLDDRLARLHVIVFDNTLAHGTCFLKVGVTQIVLAMIEQEQIDLSLILDDPVEAIHAWSHDPDFHTPARLLGRKGALTSLEMQQAIAERAARFVESGRAEGIVPGAKRILALWTETLDQLDRGDFQALAGRLDWVLKRQILEHAMHERNLGWDAPEIKHLDLLYGSLENGLYRSVEQAGGIERIVTQDRIERFVHEPPSDTRAYLRAALLRRLEPDQVVSVDWDEIRVRVRRGGAAGWPDYAYYMLSMHSPLNFTQRQCEAVVTRAESLPNLLRHLGFQETTREGRPLAGERATATSTTSEVVHGEITLARDAPAPSFANEHRTPSQGDDHGNTPKTT
jgi:Pup amidohydrolase